MKTIVVIGGGASGLMSAISAAGDGNQVILLEQKEKTGKKILSTGNGRCNFTNLDQEPICYRSDNLSFPWKVIRQFGAQNTISFFLQLGVYSRNRNGYLYPHSDQASAILDALDMELKRMGVNLYTDTRCGDIIREKNSFLIRTDNGEFRADKVILCTGSKAAPSTGSDGSGYELARALGHRIVPVLPALVQLRCPEKCFRKIAGVRVNGTISLYVEEECVAEDTGEIQFTDYGISGIPAFQVSRYAARALYEKKSVSAVLDFMPDFTEEQFVSFLKVRAQTRPEKQASAFLIGLFHQKLSDLWIRMAKIPRDLPAGLLSDRDIRNLSGLICTFKVRVTETNSFDKAQVCSGGVDTREVSSDTMESLLVPGLYFAGEILDVDGMCGGYNLQWAWATGYVAGKAAGHGGEKKEDDGISGGILCSESVS